MGLAQARRRQLAGHPHVPVGRPAAHRRVGLRSPSSARHARRRQRRPAVAARVRTAARAGLGAGRGDRHLARAAPRRGGGDGRGGGFAGGGSGVGVRSFRPERSVIPDRSLGGDRSLADRPVSPAPVHAPAASSPSPSSSPAASVSGAGSVVERPGMPERTGLAHSPAATPVLPRPTYHDHTDFRDAAPEPPVHREHAGGLPRSAAGHRASASAPSSGATGRGSDRRDYDGSAAEATVPVTAPAYVFDDPAVVDDRGRAGVTPPRQVVFEEPEPAFLDEQLELAPPASAASAASARLAPPAAEVPAPTPAALPRRYGARSATGRSAGARSAGVCSVGAVRAGAGRPAGCCAAADGAGLAPAAAARGAAGAPAPAGTPRPLPRRSPNPLPGRGRARCRVGRRPVPKRLPAN